MSTKPNDERGPLLPPSLRHDVEQVETKTVTPLPKGQVAILFLLELAEPMTSRAIYPFIVQVSFQKLNRRGSLDQLFGQLISELDITGGNPKKVGYYVGKNKFCA